DREGRLEDRPKRIGIELLPFDECNTDELLELLQETGFIRRYFLNGERYIQVINFLKHQKPHCNEKGSEIPRENTECLSDVQPRQYKSIALEVSSTADSLNTDSLITNSFNTDSFNTNSDNCDLEDEKEKSIEDIRCITSNIISYFEKNAGRTYKDRSPIEKRIKDKLSKGFTENDIITVIDKMTKEWKGTKFQTYITPSVLLGDKFEEYLFKTPCKNLVHAPRTYFNSYSGQQDIDLDAIEALAVKRLNKEFGGTL
ncbi:MAG: conserved phage C-terminal domain-containing protein, partial [Bacillota bacterium]|nr:conserved phage C-terminal domain-containing protein [Bacillota bacterium]